MGRRSYEGTSSAVEIWWNNTWSCKSRRSLILGLKSQKINCHEKNQENPELKLEGKDHGKELEGYETATWIEGKRSINYSAVWRIKNEKGKQKELTREAQLFHHCQNQKGKERGGKPSISEGGFRQQTET